MTLQILQLITTCITAVLLIILLVMLILTNRTHLQIFTAHRLSLDFLRQRISRLEIKAVERAVDNHLAQQAQKKDEASGE